MNIAIILNTGGGTLKRTPVPEAVATIKERLQKAGHKVTVQAVAPDRVSDALRTARGRDGIEAIFVGGGDGTISAAATELAGGDVALGVLPLGTMNLFARDLGIPLDLEQAVDALADGTTKQVDLGEVNGQLFIHHCSLGIHPWMIRHREQQQQRVGRTKLWAMIRAWIRVFRRFPHIEIELVHRGEAKRLRTAIVIVANNRFAEGTGPIPEHERLDEHLLAVYVGRSMTRFGLLRLSLSASLGHWDGNPMLDSFTSREVTLRRRRRRIRVSIDGEIRVLRVPLVAHTRPRALKVIVPREAQ